MIKINKYFYYWFLISFFWFFYGFGWWINKLTNSGLSITEWELFTGILPPTSYNEWNNYFLLYKKFLNIKFYLTI